LTLPDNPPRGLRWTATATAKGITTLVALIALLGAVYLGVRQQVYIDCIGNEQRLDAVRTQAISVATDTERAADLQLLAGPTPGGPTGAQLREASRLARAHTDVVRQQNPPVPPGKC
jgi:hypothetical protein